VTPSLAKITPTCQTNSPQADSRFEFHKRRQFFIGAYNEADSRRGARSTIQIVHPSRSRAETAPTTGFPGIVSGDLPLLDGSDTLVSVLNRLRRGFAHFKLCAHFL
jgi:hypothetical protein